jgi:hypothetical protein
VKTATSYLTLPRPAATHSMASETIFSWFKALTNSSNSRYREVSTMLLIVFFKISHKITHLAIYTVAHWTTIRLIVFGCYCCWHRK